MPTKRHWAEVRKTLEQNLLCDSLKGRVRYFTTRYRKAHDQTGRVCILVDKKEVINMPFYIEDCRHFEASVRSKAATQMYKDNLKDVFIEYAEQGLFYPGDFGIALNEYLSVNINDAISSDNLLVRMLAVMDRRVGKRTLHKIKTSISDLPEWLQYFYQLRLKNENGLGD